MSTPKQFEMKVLIWFPKLIEILETSTSITAIEELTNKNRMRNGLITFRKAIFCRLSSDQYHASDDDVFGENKKAKTKQRTA